MSPRQDTPGGQQRSEPIPRGIEVLVKKASVDPRFEKLLLQNRTEAARAIGLQLEPAEEMMLQAVPRDQLEAIIAQTVVPQSHRRAFLGTAAAAMLAVLGVDEAIARAEEMIAPGGVRPPPPAPAGIAPDPVPPKAETAHPSFAARVTEILSRHSRTPASRMNPSTQLDRDLRLDRAGREAVRGLLEGEFRVPIPAEVFGTLRTVGQVIDEMMVRSAVGREVIGAIARHFQVAPGKITPRTSLVGDLKANAAQMNRLCVALMARQGITLPLEEFRRTRMVGDMIQMVDHALAVKRAAIQAEDPLKVPVSRGIRPDVPPFPYYGVRPQ